MKKIEDLNTKPFKKFTPVKVVEIYKFETPVEKENAHRKAQSRLETLGLVHRENKYHLKIKDDSIEIRSRFVNTQDKL